MIQRSAAGPLRTRIVRSRGLYSTVHPAERVQCGMGDMIMLLISIFVPPETPAATKTNKGKSGGDADGWEASTLTDGRTRGGGVIRESLGLVMDQGGTRTESDGEMSRRPQARPGECTLLNIQLLPSTSQRSWILKCEQDDGAVDGAAASSDRRAWRSTCWSWRYGTRDLPGALQWNR